jgi:hypothetical protein
VNRGYPILSARLGTAALALLCFASSVPPAGAQQTAYLPVQTVSAPATVPAPAPAAPVYHSDPRNPLPLGSNAQNRPLPPGSEPADYQLQPYVEGQPLVLMSISGGGSRSAFYAASVMEELSKVPVPGVKNQQLPDGRPMYSLLDCVRGISTVSAGGLASSWYVTHFDERKQPDFFDRMKTAMSVNLQWRTYGHIALFPPLAVQLLASSVTRTDLLADEIDKLLGDRNLTFNDLRAMETRPVDPAPVLMINGTVYNSGQRLVMTNLPATRLPSIMDKEYENFAMPETDRQILRNLVQPLTFADFGSDIGSYPLSKALAASAAYPILLAPVPLRVYPQYVPPHLAGRVDEKLLQSSVAYVADGGLYENEGVDPLLSLIKTVDRKQPVLLIIIDGSERMETMRLREGKIFGPVTVISRMYDIGTLKPLAYYNNVLSEFHDPKKLEVVFVRMEGYDAKSQETLKNIPTQFKLSDEHCTALELVALQNFSRMYDPLINAYQRLGARRK